MGNSESTNITLDYSDNHQVIKALTKEDISEEAAEILIGFEECHSRITRLEYLKRQEDAQSNHATKHDVEIVKLTLDKN